MDIPLIRLTLNIPSAQNITAVVLEFMQQLNRIIAGNSTLNYHMIPVTTRPTIYIPVFQYKRGDFTENIEDVIRDRIKALKEFLSTYDFSKERKVICWLLRCIMSHFNKEKLQGMHNIFKIENRETGIKEYANINASIKLKYPKIIRHKLADGSCISVLYDPYAKEEYVTLANLSKPFSEMGYQYNALHLYEHLMTYAWHDMDHAKEIYMNGLTVVNGISNIFAVLDNPNSMLDYMHHYIDFVLKSRSPEFWNTHKEMLRTETMRTISETRLTRSYTTPSRSDPAAYDCHYNPAIFCKWSNDPFDILLITNVKVDINTQAINAKILSTKIHKITLSMPTASHIPIEALMDKQTIRVIKESPEKIMEVLQKHDFCLIPGRLYGIDNYMIFPKEVDIDFNYILHSLIYMHRYIKHDTIKDDISNYITYLPYKMTDII